MKLNQQPDALPADKYAMAVNIRALKDTDLQSRPGQISRYVTAASPVTDINSFATLQSEDVQKVTSRLANDAIYLNAVHVGTLATASWVNGASMLPFRPAASPNPYMYVANGVDYKKFPASAIDTTTFQNVGIAEPPFAPDAALAPNLSTRAPQTETIRPNAFTNPDTLPGIGLGNAWLNPGHPIDGTDADYASCQTSYAPAPNDCTATWRGFTASTFPYTALNLIIDFEAVLISGAPTPGQPFCRLFYSLDAGVTWIVIADIIVSARQNYSVVLPLGTDLTQLWFGAGTVGFSVFTPLMTVEFHIWDIKTLGTNSSGFFDQTGVAANWTPAGTAGATSDITVPGDSPVFSAPDPNNANVFSIGYTSTGAVYPWQVGQTMYQSTTPFLVLDVMQPVINATIAGIFYPNGGSTGFCIIVPNNLSVGGAPAIDGNNPVGSNFLTPSAIAALRRGAILRLNSSEYVVVQSVTIGPDNNICIETSTGSPHVAGETIVAIQTLVVFGSVAPTGSNMNAPLIQSAITTGTGTLTRTVNFFANTSQPPGLQDQDYIHVSLQIDTPANLAQIVFMFDVGDGSFTQNYFYYVMRASDLTNFLSGAQTQLAAAQIIEQNALVDASDPTLAANRGTSDSGGQLEAGSAQRTEFNIPVLAFTRVGTLPAGIVAATKVRLSVVCTGNVTLQFGATSSWGGCQPDVGQQGSPYFYRFRERSQATGVVSNPSPMTRYGVNPLRMAVTVVPPSYVYDPQTTIFDYYRYGGSVTSWRYIGSAPPGANFIDNYTDDAALAGDELDFDNFQPWPSIDVPNNGNALQVCGSSALVVSTDPDITSYLPGTLVQINGKNVYTLSTRPVSFGVTNQYVLSFVENAGAATNVPFSIQEPVIAQQRLPYMWGPDSSGTVFAVGDGLRPGTVYYSKNYNPDAAPDSYNQEIVPPSEPLMGGEILDGLSFTATSERWFALYPQPDNPAQRYSVVQQPFLRGLAAPFGHCNDGTTIYWWAKDGIYSSTRGALTDADLYNLFPHEGVEGVDVTYFGTTVYAPDYSRAGAFRLTYSNGYLYAIYQDTSGTYRCLTLDTVNNGWSADQYTPAVSCMFHPLQQVSSLDAGAPVRYDALLMGNVAGNISAQKQGMNDLGGAISCLVAGFEFDGGDLRAPVQWGDYFVDFTPRAAAGVTVTPVSLGAAIAAASVIPTSVARVRVPVSVGGLKTSDFAGVVVTWIDDFTLQVLPTSLHTWEPSYILLPALDISWQTLGSAFGLQGYMHVRQIAVAWISTAAITLTPATVDGQAPAPIVIPSSGGVYKKQLFPLTANKGQLFNWNATSPATFQFFFDDFEVHVGQWDRQSKYNVFRGFGGRTREDAPI